MNTKTVAFMVGAVAGGVAALLWAPQSGARLRRRAREKTEAIKGTVRGVVAEAKQAYKVGMEERRSVDTESIARKSGG